MGDAASWQSVGRLAAARYFFLQGAAGAIWWAMLALMPKSRLWFFPAANPSTLLSALMYADVALFVFGSIGAGLLCRRSARLASAAAGFITGVVAYAFLLALGLLFTSGQGELGVIMMAAATLLCGLCLLLITSSEAIGRTFRPANPAASHAKHTFIQSAAFWALFLGVLPAFLAWLEHRVGIPAPARSTSLSLAGIALFVAAGTLGVTSSTFMVRRGRGTPLPTSACTQLVTAGPYRHVRNPMAIAGLLQGAAIALVLASPLTLLYVVLGALVWDCVVRPLEEHDLHLRFGEEYDAYRHRVRCWVPLPNTVISPSGAARS